MITKDLQQKKSNPYKVTGMTDGIKDLDLNKRVVTGLFNSYFYIDSHKDMLVTGCASKSIQERGAGSKRGNKVKHLKDHDWSKNMARIDVLDERTVTVNGNQVEGIYHESFFPDAEDSTDLLIKLQEGLYDSRSIGFRYDKIELAVRDSDDEQERKLWDEFAPKCINPAELADGFFWVVKEIILFEGSDVAFGANQLTPMLGVKSQDRATLITKINSKIDHFQKMISKGNLSDEGIHRLEMENLQIKSYLSALEEQEPSVKDTFKKPSTKDTRKENSGKDFLKSLLT